MDFSWLSQNWFSLIFLAGIIGYIIYDTNKEKRKSAEQKKLEALEKARRAAEVQYTDDKDFACISVESVVPKDFLEVYSNLKKEGYAMDKELNEISPYDSIVFLNLRKK